MSLLQFSKLLKSLYDNKQSVYALFVSSVSLLEHQALSLKKAINLNTASTFLLLTRLCIYVYCFFLLLLMKRSSVVIALLALPIE